MDVSYSNLTQVKRQWQKNNDTNLPVTDPVMMDFARRVSATIDVETQMEFMPRSELRKYNVATTAQNGDINSSNNLLYLNYPMVELTAVTLASSTALTVDTDVRLFPAGGQSPAMELQLSTTTANNWTDVSSTGFDDISITGLWCWRDRYTTDGWQLSGDAIKTDAINTTITSIQVTDADGTNYFGDTPRFDPGQMIKIEDELMAVTATDTTLTPNTITVIRGIRGSTAASHDAATAISVYYPQPDIVRAAQLIAFYNLARRGKTDRVTFDGVQTTATIEIPVEAQVILDRYKPRGL